jgi:anti-sigma factor RsiW
VSDTKTPTQTPTHIAEDDLSLFAMQLLSESEMTATARHIETCGACRSRLAEIQGDLAVLALTSELHMPAPGARNNLLDQVAKEKKFIPPVQASDANHDPVLAQRNSRMFEVYSKEDPPARRSVAPFLAWTGWAIAAAIGVFAFLQFQQRELFQHDLTADQATLSEAVTQSAHAQDVLRTLTDTGAMRVALHQPGVAPTKPLPEAHASYVADKGALVLVATHLDQLADNKTYELWLLPSDKSLSPIPAGLFRPDASGSATVVMPELPKGVVAKGFGVTVEADGGARTPTAPIVLAGF